MFRASARATRLSFKRFNSSGHHDAPAPTQNEIDVTKVFGVALLAGVSLFFYRSSKEPVIKTPLYNQVEDRVQMRNEAYAKKYKASFIKSFIRDKGGIGSKQHRRQAIGAVPTVLIPTHSPYANQFGAGIKTADLGPRKERVKYYAPLEN
ncbi:hypothetical protein FT663_04943 [Candidozyma haemuli var. vulneris]|uniref:Uncharacterized protein n=1 Tax=Candidozyma haemuli TaxID=45357 RepID=A0A2V1AMX4_9ASCO|nr:hypothetical protein CXQ85_001338 [[Candida] haemuloni]KAF3985656.1 hypothetical protein FT662_05022 [[Candida] haemuloni var. vulneris]KAF3986292.1 hypothetical protein FT663_04943 [[Candida] haemuloni var. vulneris]PVH19044.1 hypothetical protein CXQ85_001338 [[Candida] haemuloni]